MLYGRRPGEYMQINTMVRDCHTSLGISREERKCDGTRVL